MTVQKKKPVPVEMLMRPTLIANALEHAYMLLYGTTVPSETFLAMTGIRVLQAAKIFL